MASSDATVNNQIDAFTYYHIIQEQSSSGLGPALPALGHALAGSIATASAKAVVYPIELCITRLQVQRQLRGKGEAESAAKDAEKEYSSVIDAARKIYNTEGGLKAFYTGCGSDVAKGIIDSFLFFLAYNFVRQHELKKSGTKHLSIPKELGVGIAAGSFAKFFTTPIQNIVTRQQTAALVAARDPISSTTAGESDYLSVKDIALQIRSERGISGFWAGYPASVILTLNPAITFAVDGFLKRLLPKSRRDNPTPQLTFLIAALSKAVATAITYPVMLSKSRSQATSPSSTTSEKSSAEQSPNAKRSTLLAKILYLFRAQHALYTSLRRIYRNEGLSGLYSGLEGEVVKGFLQHGFTMMAKENVHVGVIQAYYLLLRATKRWPDDAGKAAKGVKDEAGRVAEGIRAGAGGAMSGVQEKIGEVGQAVQDGAKKVVGIGGKE